MFPVAAATAAGWLLLFFVLLVISPREDGATPEPTPGAEPPAVVSLLAGRLQRDGFVVTLADLAARGWFRLSVTPGPAGPVMCVVPAETPTEPLAPYERRVMAHVALRAGVRGEVPAPALADSFEGGEDAFMKAFREEVTADTEQRGLTRPRLSGRRIGLLCLVLFVPAGALAFALDAAHQRYPLAWIGVSWVVVATVTGGIGVSRRPSATGQAVLDRWHAAADAARGGGPGGYGGSPGGYGGDPGGYGGGPGGYGGGPGSYGGDARVGAYAAALGRAPGAVTAFAAPGKAVVWSSYRGSWQQLPLETYGSSWPCAIAWMLAIIFGPFVLAGGLIGLFAAGLGWLAERLIGLAVAAVLVSIVIWVARRMVPRFAEFDGQVIRQTFIEHDEDPDEFRVVVDDGVRPTAWDLRVAAESWRLLPPGTFVHARVNLHNREAAIHPAEPPAVARPLAGVAAEQERAVTGGLPDPALLVTAEEAAGVLRCAVQGKHVGSPASRVMIWQPAGAARPVLRVEVRGAGPPSGSHPDVPPDARPVPGVAGGYLAGQSAVLDAGSCTVTISIHGAGPTGGEAALIRLLPVVAARLRSFPAGLVSRASAGPIWRR